MSTSNDLCYGSHAHACTCECIACVCVCLPHYRLCRSEKKMIAHTFTHLHVHALRVWHNESSVSIKSYFRGFYCNMLIVVF